MFFYKNAKEIIIYHLIYSFVLLITIILFLPSTSYGYAYRPITSNSSLQSMPDVSGNRIVWQDNRNGNEDIYLYDITTGTETAITNDSSRQYSPKISGTKIVWYSDKYGTYDVYYYDLSTNTVNRLTTSSGAEVNPDISGNIIVWTNTINIYVYDISTATTRRLTSNGSSVSANSPAIAGNKVVWHDNRSKNNDIFLYDLSTSQQTRITSQLADQAFPDINSSGSQIVWEDHRNGNWDIYNYNIPNNSHQRLTVNSDSQVDASISNNIVAYRDNRNGNFDIYTYNISSGNEARLNLNILNQYSPSISGDKIAFVADTPPNTDIGLFDIQNPITVSVISPATPNGTNGWYTTIPLVALGRSEPGSTAYAFFETGPFGTYTGPIAIPNGQRTLYYISRDFAGNFEPVMRIRNIKVDTVKPVTTFSTIPTAPGSDGWFNTIPIIRLSRSEQSNTYYSFVSSSGPWSNYADLFRPPVGENTIYYYSIDPAGNTETFSSRVIKVKNTTRKARLGTKTTLSSKVKIKKVKINKGKKKGKRQKIAIFKGRLVDSQKMAVANKRVIIKSRVLRIIKKRVKGRIRKIKKYVWKQVKRVLTDSRGRFSVSLGISKTLIVHARYNGNSIYRPSSSRRVTATIRK